MNETVATNKKSKNANGHYLMLLIFSAATIFKWYVYATGYNYYKTDATPESIVSIILSIIVIVLLLSFIKQTKEKWAKRYLISFLLFLIMAHSLKYISETMFSVDAMPLIDAIFFSLFCLNLIFFLYIYKQTGFTIFTKNITNRST